MRLPDELLLQVAKPGRYTGGEINSAVKRPESVAVRFAFCFPEVYEVGMSNLGLQILYYFLNRREDCYCERAFLPWPDMLSGMKKRGIPLFALETGDSLRDFDILGFTMQYELNYTNILAMLEAAGLPFYSRERGEEYPVVCAGGPCAVNPEPLADFIDFFYIGDGEANLD